MLKATIFLSIIAVITYLFDTFSYTLKLVVFKNKQYTLTSSTFNMFSVGIKFFITFQAPLLGVLIDESIRLNINPLSRFRLIVLCASIGILLAIILLPTFLNIFPLIVSKVAKEKSAIKGAVSSVRSSIDHTIKEVVVIPNKSMFAELKYIAKYKWIVLANLLVQAIFTIGNMSAYYASYYMPENRLSIAGFSGTINSVASIIMLLWLEPKIAIITDDVYKGNKQYNELKLLILILILTKLFGTLLAQILIEPSSFIILEVYKFLVHIK